MENEQTYQSDSKLIMTNTIMLYIRQILILLVSLYTSRIILNALGENDYGIYNVVAGFVTMFNVVSGAFSSSIAKYMAYSVGKNDMKKVEQILSTSVILQLGLGFVLVMLIIVFGFLYIDNVMVIGDDRVFATKVVLLLSVFSFWVNLLSIPYNSMIIAFEKMKAFAYIGLMDSILKLLTAFITKVCLFDKLIIYGFLIVLDAILVRFMYMVYCRKKISDIRFKFCFNGLLLKELLSFTGWIFLGNGAYVIKDQGYNMIMNVFCGPAVNSARAIAVQVNAGIYGFSSNFMQAVQPQITKLGSVNKKDDMNKISCQTAKLAWYLMLMLCLPVIKNIDFLLVKWLGIVPDYTAVFIVFSLMESMLSSVSNPFLYGILADGKIKVYMISMSLISLLSIGAVFVALKVGYSPVSAYVISFVSKLFIFLVLIWQSKVINNIRIINLIRYLFLPILFVSMVSFWGVLYIAFETFSPFVRFVLESSVLEVLLIGAILIGGISKDERQFIKSKFKSILRKIKQIIMFGLKC